MILFLFRFQINKLFLLFVSESWRLYFSLPCSISSKCEIIQDYYFSFIWTELSKFFSISLSFPLRKVFPPSNLSPRGESRNDDEDANEQEWNSRNFCVFFRCLWKLCRRELQVVKGKNSDENRGDWGATKKFPERHWKKVHDEWISSFSAAAVASIALQTEMKKLLWFLYYDSIKPNCSRLMSH